MGQNQARYLLNTQKPNWAVGPARSVERPTRERESQCFSEQTLGYEGPTPAPWDLIRGTQWILSLKPH